MLRIIALNLNDSRSAWRKNVLFWVFIQNVGIIYLQELKVKLPDLTPEVLAPDGMRIFLSCAEKKLTGVLLFGAKRSRIGAKVKSLDTSCRMKTLSIVKRDADDEFECPLVGSVVPTVTDAAIKFPFAPTQIRDEEGLLALF